MEVLSKYLERLLLSPRLSEVLYTAGQLTDVEEVEAGVDIFKELGKTPYVVSDVRRGGQTRMFSDDALDWELDEPTAMMLQLPSYKVLSVHYHPGREGTIVPSVWLDASDGTPIGDLATLTDERAHVASRSGYATHPLMGIAKYRGGKAVDVMLVQERGKMVPPNDLSDLEIWLRQFDDRTRFEQDAGLAYDLTNEVVTMLENSGLYNAAQVRCRDGRPLRRDMRHLARFAFLEQPLGH